MSTGIPAKSGQRQAASPVFLQYCGKHSTEEFLNRPARHYNKLASLDGGGGNAFYFGDNADALRHLLACGMAGKLTLSYMDPPFATSMNFANRDQEHAYDDTLCGAEFVEFLRERVVLVRELLSDEGSLYLHLDGNMAFKMKIILDEIFGEKNCRAFITRKKCSTKNYTKTTYGDISDYVMFYSKTSRYVWNRPCAPWELNRMIEEYPYVDEATGRRFKKVPLHAPGIRHGETGKKWRGKLPPPGKHWQYAPSKLDELDAAGEICWSPNGNPRRKVFCDPDKGIPVQNIWLNYRDSVNQAQKTTGYPTEKNLAMLEMIVQASSNPGDLVLDCFAGSGTTLDAAFRHGRTWIGMDLSLESCKAIIRRFTRGLERHGDYVGKRLEKTVQANNEARCPFDVLADERHAQVLNDANIVPDSPLLASGEKKIRCAL